MAQVGKPSVSRCHRALFFGGGDGFLGVNTSTFEQENLENTHHFQQEQTVQVANFKPPNFAIKLQKLLDLDSYYKFHLRKKES